VLDEDILKIKGIQTISKFPAKKTVEFVIPTTLERYGTKEFMVIVRYISAKESGPGFLQRPKPDTIYIANYNEHVIRPISVDVKPEGEKEEKTPGFTFVCAFSGILAVIYLCRQKK
jgi:hypothetical protein